MTGTSFDTPPAPPASSIGGALRNFYGVFANTQSYLNMLYLLFAFPLGIFYFVFLVTGLSVGIATAIIWVGFVILALVGGGWFLLAGFERWMTEHVLRQPMPTVPVPESALVPENASVWTRLKRHLSNRVTWTSLLFLFTKFPLGVVSFVAVVCSFSISLASVAAPLAFYFRGLEVGPLWWLDSVAGAAVLSAIGLAVFLPLSLHLMNALASFGVVGAADPGPDDPRRHL